MLVMAFLGVQISGCDSGVTPSNVTDPDSGALNSTLPYDKDILLISLPDIPTFESSQLPSISYNTTSAKGNDLGSTKKADLIMWYDNIRHADLEDKFRNFNGSDFVFREIPQWGNVQKIGIFSQPYADNALDFYNFLRSLFGAQRSYMSGYKQIAAQASSWSNLGGGHYPTLEMAEKEGINKETFNLAYAGRELGNLQGGSVNKTADYKMMKTLPRNDDLTSIWDEGSADGIQGMAHRNVFMDYRSRDVGIGLVEGFHTWLVWGSDPLRNNGSGLGGEEQLAIFDAYSQGLVPNGVIMYPSNGYYPFFALKGANQSTSVKFNSAYVEPTAKPLEGVVGETISLTMEYFRHEKDGDLTTLSVPYKTMVLSDVIGTDMTQGGRSPGSKGVDWVALCKPDPADQTLPLVCPEGVVESGGYHFTTGHGGMPLVFRMPYGWFKEMQENFQLADEQNILPQYHTVRYSFSSKKADGTKGESLLVKTPFYMNPTVGAPLVLQTTFFDINRLRDVPVK